MKDYPYIKMTKREFIREKRKYIKQAKKILQELRSGCACWKIFGTSKFQTAVDQMQVAIDKMDEITRDQR